METFITILGWCVWFFGLIFIIWAIKTRKNLDFTFPKGMKFRKALLMWLDAGWGTYDKRGRRKYCSECGWRVIYLDELYDVPAEACSPDVVAVCEYCGTEYVEFESFTTNRKAVLVKE